MTETADKPRKGQVVKFRRSGRIQYMRLTVDAIESASDMSEALTLYGYRTRADGSPTTVRPVARVLHRSKVEIVPPRTEAD